MSEPSQPVAIKSQRNPLYVEPSIRTIAGALIVALTVLIYYSHDALFIWLAMLLFIGFNLFQSGISGFCLMEKILKALGCRSEIDEIRSLSKKMQVISKKQADYLETLTLLNEAIIELSIDGRILSVSEGWLRITGETDCDRAVDKPLAYYLRTGDHEYFGQSLDALVYGRTKNCQIDFRLLLNNEESKWISANFMLVEHENGCTIKGVLSDISVSKQLKDERRIFQTELTHARRLSNLGEMAAGLAHELNQPLAAINLYIQGCLKRLNTEQCKPDEIQEVMTLASQQAKRAGDIIKQMRNFVRKTPLTLANTDINFLIKESLHLLDNDPAIQDVVFSLELEDNMPKVAVDRLQIQQVLINLVSNAIESMDEVLTNKPVLIRTLLSEKEVAIEVCDQGKGIPENLQADLFQPFTTGRKDGLGLGLAISRSIIEEHGGGVYHKNLKERGTCFSFTLPIENNHD